MSKSDQAESNMDSIVDAIHALHAGGDDAHEQLLAALGRIEQTLEASYSVLVDVEKHVAAIRGPNEVAATRSATFSAANGGAPQSCCIAAAVIALDGR